MESAKRAVGVLENLLRSRKDGILQRWLDLVLESFPANSRPFLKSEGNEFHNPVGAALREGTAQLLQGLIEGATQKEMEPALDRIVRIRAVQECLPSEATAFVFRLKDAIRAELAVESDGGPIPGEILAFESKIDRLAQDAFDKYADCKQRIWEIRARAEQARFAKLLERMTRQESGSCESAGASRDGD